MPPKKRAQSTKSEQKRKDKLLEDKTFGLKNKNKSKNVQKYIAEVTKQVKGANTRVDRLKEREKSNVKKNKELMDETMKNIFAAAIIQPKVGFFLRNSFHSAPMTVLMHCHRYLQASTQSHYCVSSSSLLLAQKYINMFLKLDIQ